MIGGDLGLCFVVLDRLGIAGVVAVLEMQRTLCSNYTNCH
jgi:hypothetical protein